MEPSLELLKILVCPVTKGPLVYDRQNKELISEMAGLAYPVKDGIPLLLPEAARKINKNAYKPAPNRMDYIASAVDLQNIDESGDNEITKSADHKNNGKEEVA